MTFGEAVGIGGGVLAIVAPEWVPKMRAWLRNGITAAGFLILGYSGILALQDVTGMRIQPLPLIIIVLGALVVAGGVFLHTNQARKKAEALHEPAAPSPPVQQTSSSQQTPAPNLEAEVPQYFVGGIDPSRPSFVTATFILKISNSGNLQSFADSWTVSAINNGAEYQGTIRRINSSITLLVPTSGDIPAQEVIYREEDAIYSKAATPIQPGAMTHGILFTTFSADREALIPASFRISFRDVLKREYIVWATPGTIGQTRTYPQINPIERK